MFGRLYCTSRLPIRPPSCPAPQPGPGDEHATFRQGLLRHFHKQSSAANLTRLAGPGELRRLQEETRCVIGFLAALLGVLLLKRQSRLQC